MSSDARPGGSLKEIDKPYKKNAYFQKIHRARETPGPDKGIFMGNKKKEKKPESVESASGGCPDARSEDGEKPVEAMTGKRYREELKKLQTELVHLQRWIVSRKLKVCIVFEGRDGAGKGGAIKALTERVSPRIFQTVALAAPTEREKTQMYFQRYLTHLPAGG